MEEDVEVLAPEEPAPTIPIIQKELEYLQNIPQERWCTGTLQDSYYQTIKCCALGHIYHRRHGIHNDPCKAEQWQSPYNFEINRLVLKYFKDRTGLPIDLASVNDGWGFAPPGDDEYKKLRKMYPQDNPKDRVIACLKDMIANGY